MATQPKIYIWVGHGGTSTGAVNTPAKLVEKALNLSTALNLKSQLIAGGYDVKLSRETDKTVPTATIMAEIKAYKPNIVWSIHHNSFDSKVTGFDVFYQIGSTTSKAYADALGREFKAIGQNPHGVGVRTKLYPATTNVDYYECLRLPYQANFTAILSEFCFIDSEAKEIDEPRELIAEATAMFKAIHSVLKYAPVVAAPAKPVVPTVDYKALYEKLSLDMTAQVAKFKSIQTENDSLKAKINKIKELL